MEKTVQTGRVDVQVMSHGQPLREYLHNGKTYVAGSKGQPYSLRIANGTGRRVLVVLTVDGKSVMDGKPGTKDGNGYVLAPWQTADIPGWRLNDSSVASFVFGTKEESYAAKSGDDAANVGVIGAAFFDENVPTPLAYVPRVTTPEMYHRPASYGQGAGQGMTRGFGQLYSLGHDAGDAPRSVADVVEQTSTPVVPPKVSLQSVNAGPVQALGTGFGQQASHNIGHTHFDRRTPEAALFEIHYNDRENLVKLGVNFDAPEAFPADKGDVITGCQPPEGWKA